MKNKVRGSFINFDDVDPAVAASIGGAERRQSQARLPVKERQKKAKARTKDQARLERRVNWDLPIELKTRVKSLAAEHVVPESQVAALFIADGLRRLDAGEIDLDDYKTPSDSPRYDANLILDEAGLQEIQKTRRKGRLLAKSRDAP